MQVQRIIGVMVLAIAGLGHSRVGHEASSRHVRRGLCSRVIGCWVVAVGPENYGGVIVK